MFDFLNTPKMLMVVGVLAVVAAGYFYVKGLQHEVETLKVDNILLKEAVDTQSRVIQKIKADTEAIVRHQSERFFLIEQLNEEITDLSNRFNKTPTGTTRDIGVLAINKTETIQKIINRGSADAMRCLEIASGAQLTEEELSADARSEINTLCPGIANPSYAE